MSSVLRDLWSDCSCENVACGRCICLQISSWTDCRAARRHTRRTTNGRANGSLHARSAAVASRGSRSRFALRASFSSSLTFCQLLWDTVFVNVFPFLHATSYPALHAVARCQPHNLEHVLRSTFALKKEPPSPHERHLPSSIDVLDLCHLATQFQAANCDAATTRRSTSAMWKRIPHTWQGSLCECHLQPCTGHPPWAWRSHASHLGRIWWCHRLFSS